MKRVAAVLVLVSALGFAQDAARPIAIIRSGKPVTVDGADMPPTGSASYPVVPRDEIATQASTLLTANDRGAAVLDADTRVRIDLLSDSASGTAGKPFYIFLRHGGMTFDAKGGRMYICASGLLIVPEAHSRGSVRMNPAGAVTLMLTGGTFAEQGKRGCSETGISGALSGISGTQAAGGAIAPAGGVIAPLPAASAGVSTTAIAAGAIAVGLGAAAGASTFTSTSLNCASAGCNTIPGAVSSSQP